MNSVDSMLTSLSQMLNGKQPWTPFPFETHVREANEGKQDLPKYEADAASGGKFEKMREDFLRQKYGKNGLELQNGMTSYNKPPKDESKETAPVQEKEIVAFEAKGSTKHKGKLVEMSLEFR